MVDRLPTVGGGGGCAGHHVSLALQDKLRLAAMRAVESDLVCSRHALLLRVVSGELAKQRPVLEFGGG